MGGFSEINPETDGLRLHIRPLSRVKIVRIRTGSHMYPLKIVNDVLKQAGIVPKYAGK